jgi:hypothetical protein
MGTLYNNSLVVIAPNNAVDLAINMAAALGYTVKFSVSLSETGEPPYTHRGLHVWARDELKEVLTGEKLPDLSGYSKADISALLGMIHVSASTNVIPAEHFDQFASSLNLKRPKAEYDD